MCYILGPGGRSLKTAGAYCGYLGKLHRHLLPRLGVCDKRHVRKGALAGVPGKVQVAPQDLPEPADHRRHPRAAQGLLHLGHLDPSLSELGLGRREVGCEGPLPIIIKHSNSGHELFARLRNSCLGAPAAGGSAVHVRKHKYGSAITTG